MNCTKKRDARAIITFLRLQPEFSIIMVLRKMNIQAAKALNVRYTFQPFMSFWYYKKYKQIQFFLTKDNHLIFLCLWRW